MFEAHNRGPYDFNHTTTLFTFKLTAGGLIGAGGACVHNPVVEEHRRAHGPARVPRQTRKARRALGRSTKHRRATQRPARVCRQNVNYLYVYQNARRRS